MPTNRQCRLAARPAGTPGPETFDFADEDAGEPGEGRFLVRTRFISIDPAMRGWMNDARSYLPPVGIGEVMRAGAVGEVVASRHEGFPEGSHVAGAFGVQEYALSDGAGAIAVDPGLAPLPRYLGTLGMTGMTAYFGLLDVGALAEGDTVVVSGAAGAVGGTVGQIARIRGARAVGVAGGPEKCRHVVEDLGFDACVDHRSRELARELRDATPEGIDVYFDNVGGEVLDLALTRLAHGARVVVCGAISQYNAEGPVAGPANYLSLLVNRARMEGFLVFDYARRYGEAAREMAGWIADGKLRAEEDVAEGGVDAFPETLARLFRGDNVGKLVLRV